jgi:23S rRNA (guanosine2251-2'-O)-methyltransferase
VFQVRKCLNPDCGLRFTLGEESQHGARCPRCRSATRLIIDELGPQRVPQVPWEGSRPRIEVLLDNVRSAWNVGAIFRVADGAGVVRLHLCGVTPTPAQPNVRKTSLGAEAAVAWEWHADGAEWAVTLRQRGLSLWALEGGLRAEPLAGSLVYLPAALVLVVGNEVSGVDPGIVEQCERVVYLPMQGSKGSLNVATAFSVAVYWMAFGAGG